MRIEGNSATNVTVRNCRIANNNASYGRGISQTNNISVSYNAMNNTLNVYYLLSKSEEFNVQIINLVGQVITAELIKFEVDDTKINYFYMRNLQLECVS